MRLIRAVIFANTARGESYLQTRSGTVLFMPKCPTSKVNSEVYGNAYAASIGVDTRYSQFGPRMPNKVRDVETKAYMQ